MGFSDKQVQALRRNLSSRNVRTREANGRELSYIEGWYAISQANRIFSFDGWNRETVELPLRAHPGASWCFPGGLHRQGTHYGACQWRHPDPGRPWVGRRAWPVTR